MHFRFHRHGPRWEAFADHVRDALHDRDLGGNFGFAAGNGRGRRAGGGARGRVLDSAELRLVLLKLLADEPRHGYELIKAIEALSGGHYAPSPGMVYPTLALLADLGQLFESLDGSRKRYAITEAGSAVLASEADAVATAMARLEDLARLTTRDAGPVRRATRNLQAVLAARLAQADGGDAAAQRTLQLDIAAILDEAAARIERL